MTEAEWLACVDPLPMWDFMRGKSSDRKMRLLGVACCERMRHATAHPKLWNAVAVAELFADGLATRDALTAAETAAAYADCTMTEINASFAVRRVSLPEWERGHAPDDYYGPKPLLLHVSAQMHVTAYLSGCRPEDVAAVRRALDAEEESTRGMQPSYMNLAAQAEAAALVAAAGPAYEAFQRNTRWGVVGPVHIAEAAHQADLFRDAFGDPFRPATFSPDWRTDTATAIARQMYESRDFGAMPILADALQDAGCDSADILNHCRSDGPHVRGCWVVDLVLGKS